MRTATRCLIAAIVAGCLGSSYAWADGCSDADVKEGTARLRMAEAAERSGKLKEAYQFGQQAAQECLSTDDGKRQLAMRQRLGLQLGQREERAGRLDTAFDWYMGSKNEAEGDRVKMKQVSANSANRNLVSGAVDHFQRRDDHARVAQLRALVAKNFASALDSEDRAFASRRESFEQIEDAGNWAYLLDDGAARKVRERAGQRGEVLLKEDTHRRLDNAMRYFDIAGAKAKMQAVKDKARRLAQEHEKKGEVSEARDFYVLAGEAERGGMLENKAEAAHKRSEEKRQKQFKKEQDDLEKQLGL